jgi:aspartyl-tRNA synthetase
MDQKPQAPAVQESDERVPSKSALKKAAKEAEKAKKKAETSARLAAEKAARQGDESTDVSKGKYGVLPLIQSTSRTGIYAPPITLY